MLGRCAHADSIVNNKQINDIFLVVLRLFTYPFHVMRCCSCFSFSSIVFHSCHSEIIRPSSCSYLFVRHRPLGAFVLVDFYIDSCPFKNKAACAIWSALSSRGGSMFVAGRAGAMPRAVREAVIAAAQSQHGGGLDRASAEAWVRALEKQGRYYVEAW